jgi:hypothetical protein
VNGLAQQQQQQQKTDILRMKTPELARVTGNLNLSSTKSRNGFLGASTTMSLKGLLGRKSGGGEIGTIRGGGRRGEMSFSVDGG